MALKATYKLEGVEELKVAFELLGKGLTEQVLEEVLRAPAKAIRAEARARAPKSGTGGTKALSRRIKISSRLSRRQMAIRGGKKHLIEIFVGPTAPHSHLIEYGFWHTVNRGPKKGTRTRFVAPRPFWRPSVAVVAPKFDRMIIDGLRPAIDRVVKRVRSQARRGKVTNKTLRAGRSR